MLIRELLGMFTVHVWKPPSHLHSPLRITVGRPEQGRGSVMKDEWLEGKMGADPTVGKEKLWVGILSQSRRQNLKELNELGRRGLADSHAKKGCVRMCNQSGDLQSAVCGAGRREQAITFLQGLQGKRLLVCPRAATSPEAGQQSRGIALWCQCGYSTL